MGLDDDPIHKDLHADEDMGDGGGVLVNCSVLRTKKNIEHIWTDYQSFDLIEAVAKPWCV